MPTNFDALQVFWQGVDELLDNKYSEFFWKPAAFWPWNASWRKGLAVLTETFVPAVAERAFGPPGTPGDEATIRQLTGAIFDACEFMCAWAAQVRGLSGTPQASALFEAVAQLANGPLNRLIDVCIAGVNTIRPTDGKPPTGTPTVLDFRLDLSFDTSDEARAAEALENLVEAARRDKRRDKRRAAKLRKEQASTRLQSDGVPTRSVELDLADLRQLTIELTEVSQITSVLQPPELGD